MALVLYICLGFLSRIQWPLKISCGYYTSWTWRLNLRPEGEWTVVPLSAGKSRLNVFSKVPFFQCNIPGGTQSDRLHGSSQDLKIGGCGRRCGGGGGGGREVFQCQSRTTPRWLMSASSLFTMASATWAWSSWNGKTQYLTYTALLRSRLKNISVEEKH